MQLLAADKRLQQLNDYVPPLALIRTMGVSRDEKVHSRLLAMLLDPRRHAGAEAMLRMLLHKIASQQSLDRQVAERLRAMADASWQHVTVGRELFFIDIVVKITSAEGAAVIGIENKIDADEQPKQIARYQEALGRAYPDRAAAIVFLTPAGREPTTARPNAPVPAVALGYDVISAAVEETRRQAVAGSRDERVLSEVAVHLREDILGEPREVSELVRELWKTHGRALRLALKHRPRLSDIRKPYEERLRDYYGDDMHFSYWPERRRDLQVIKIQFKSWTKKGFPFTFMLYTNNEGSPYVRALIRGERYEQNAVSLASWARRVNASVGILIDENFRRSDDWRAWREILREEHYPSSAALEEDAFDEDTVRAAADTVFTLVELLRPHVDAA